jgi:site-specific recombinase XerD
MNLNEVFRAAAVEQSLSRNTQQNYQHWFKKFYGFCKTPASQWTPELVRKWMLSLHDQSYSPVSRKQALCAVKFVFNHLLKKEMGWLDLPPMPKIRKTLRTIPTREEIARIFAGMEGQSKLMAALMYGGGLRVSECCHLRVQDVDLEAKTIRVWDGKGQKCRLTIIPAVLIPSLRRHLDWRQALHNLDTAAGGGFVELPGRLAKKYKSAPREFRWQWLWPSEVKRGQYRWFATDEMVSKQMRRAVKSAGIVKRVTPHCLRHAFATHAMQVGNDIKTVQELLGHEDMNMTAIYLHADAAHGLSPMDAVACPAPVQPLAIEEWN